MKEKEKISSLLEEAKTRYPVGTKYKAANDEWNIYTVNAQIFSMPFGDVIQAEKGKRLLYDRGKWAEIVSLPSNNKENKDSVEVKPDNNTIKFEVGKYYSYTWGYNPGSSHVRICKIKRVDDVHLVVDWDYSLKDKKLYNCETHVLIEEVSNIKELTKEEIQQYLPDGHMDKIKTSNSIPEYVECVSHPNNKTFLNGKIYKCQNATTEEVILINEFNRMGNYPYNGVMWTFKPSTKEAYEKQQQQQKVEAEPKKIDVKTSITRAIKEDNPQILVDEWGLSAEEICGKINVKHGCYKLEEYTDLPYSCDQTSCDKCYFSNEYKTLQQCKDWIMKASKNKKESVTSESDKVGINENLKPSAIPWSRISDYVVSKTDMEAFLRNYPYDGMGSAIGATNTPSVTDDRIMALSQAMIAKQYAIFLQNTLPQVWLSEDDDDIIEYKPLPPLKEIDVEFIPDEDHNLTTNKQ